MSASKAPAGQLLLVEDNPLSAEAYYVRGLSELATEEEVDVGDIAAACRARLAEEGSSR